MSDDKNVWWRLICDDCGRELRRAPLMLFWGLFVAVLLVCDVPVDLDHPGNLVMFCHGLHGDHITVGRTRPEPPVPGLLTNQGSPAENGLYRYEAPDRALRRMREERR